MSCMSRAWRAALAAALSLLVFNPACVDPDDGAPDAPEPTVDDPGDKAPAAGRARVRLPWGEREVTYEVVGDLAIMEGDIILGRADELARKANLQLDLTERWPNGVVPYAFHTDVTATMRARVETAIARFHERTPIRFVLIANPCDLGDDACGTDYVLFRNNPKSKTASNSALGMNGGQQLVNLGADNNDGVYTHELGHAVGLYHEQNRSDRDVHVAYNPFCVANGWLGQFEKNGPDERFGPYDFRSIMHYRSGSGSIDGTTALCPTGFPIVRKPGAAACPAPFCTDADGDGFAERIDGRSELSDGDVNALWAMYGGELAVPESGDLLGSSVAVADFDQDGFVDVAAGAPGEAVLNDTVPSAGAVLTYKGGPEGFQPWALFTQETAGGASRPGDRFGDGIVVGDFDADGFPDLAVSAPDDEIAGRDNAGAVYVLRGGPGGLAAGQIVTQLTIGALNEANDRFGSALAVGDFNGDGVDDLAVGARGEAPPGGVAAGWVYVLRGQAGGAIALTLFDSVGQDEPIGYGPAWTIGDPMGAPAAGDMFGFSLAAGRLDADARDDLIVGAPYDDDQILNGGAAYVLRGGASGMIAWQRISDLFTDAHQRNGWSVAGGDLDGDGLGEVALGMPEARVDGVAAAGAVRFFQVSGVSLVQGARLDGNDLPGDVAAGDRVGRALWFEPFARQLFVGVPWEDNGGVGDAGVAHRIELDGATPVHDHQFRQSPDGIEEAGDRFGWSIATAPHGLDTWIAIGSPGENGMAGAILVYRSLLAGAPVHIQNLLQDTDGSESD